MNITNWTYFYIAITIVIALIFIIISYEKTFFKKVKRYWFYKRSRLSIFSSLLFFLALIILAVTIGDIRGKERLVESSIPNQKTVLLIDSSASMMVEDVRPFRLAKAAIIARHFIRNSFGHQVSIAVFSDIQRKIVPFTDDLEILQSRLEVLLSNSAEGSSNVNLALKEAFQYFYTQNGYETGNVLLITDGEQHSFVDIKVPEKINLAVVGVGTEKGGRIPVRNKKGNFIRYKKHNGTEVVSKLDRRYFESLISKAKHGKVWYAGSYALPTKEILAFFDKRHKEVFTSGQFRERPVEGYLFIKIAISLFILSVFFGRFKTFVTASLVLFVMNGNYANAQDYDELFQKLKNGDISKSEKLKLSEFFLENKSPDKALTIYEESLEDLEKEDAKHVVNYGTLLFKNKKYKEAIDAYDRVDEKRLDPKALELMRKNKLAALKKNQQDQKNKNKEKNKDKKDKNKDKKNKSGQQDQNDKKNKKGSKGKNQDNQKKKDKSKSKEEKKKSESDKKKEEQKKKEQKQKKKNWEDIKNDIRKKKNMSKVKGVLKQIVNDDRNIQKKFMKTSKQRQQRDVKDW